MGGGSSKGDAQMSQRQLEDTSEKLTQELTRLVEVTHFELLTPDYIGNKLEESMQLKLTKEQQQLIRQHVQQVLASHFKSHYRVGDVLGKGGYSVVHNCVRMADNTTHAVKVIDKTKSSKNALKSLKDEIGVMRKLKHPRLMELREVFDHGPTIYLVLEKVEGGELFDEIVRLQKYTEKIASEILFNFLDGLKFMHDHGFVHRDIKPENILLLRKPRNIHDICSDIKIADFGFAAYVGEEETLTTCCGTPRYIAPEVLEVGLFPEQERSRKGYGKTCDMWAVGVIAYILLFGKAPFYHKDRKLLWQHIRGAIWNLPPEAKRCSPEAVSFMKELLVVDTKKRLSATQAINHPFITKNTKEEDLPDTLQNLKEFSAKEKFKAAIFGVQSLSRVTYIQRCFDMGLKTNTAIVKQIDTGDIGADTVDLDLTKNYVGAKGLCAILDMVHEGCPALETINLNGCQVNNKVISALVDVGVRHPKLRAIDLSNNPLSFTAGTQLLQMLKANPRIKDVDLQNTKIQDTIMRQITAQLEQNKSGKMKDYFKGSKSKEDAAATPAAAAPAPDATATAVEA